MSEEFQYQPGVCNIGVVNRRSRFIVGVMAFAAVFLLRFTVLSDAPRWWRLGLVPVLFLGFLSFLQARARFCVMHGFQGTYHSDRLLGKVQEAQARTLDYLRSKSLIIQALIGAVVVGALIFLV